jgi:hypothetical protein
LKVRLSSFVESDVYETEDGDGVTITVRPVGKKGSGSRTLPNQGLNLFKVTIEEDEGFDEEHYVTEEIKDQILQEFNCKSPRRETLLEETEEEVEL